MKNLADHLGPVKAQTYRQASRFANTLKAGYPVHNYSDLARSRVILFCAADRKLHTLLSELEAVDLDWQRKVVLLCAGYHDSGALQRLAAKGASVGSLFPVGGTQNSRFFVEGEPLAVRAAKVLVRESGGQVVQVTMGRSEVCSAGVMLATTLLVSAMHGSAQCFRQAGLSSREASATVGSLAQMSLRGFLKAGMRAYKLPRSPEERYVFRRQVELLGRIDPELGSFFSELGKLVLKSQGGDASWLEEPPLRPYHVSSAGA